MQKQSSLSDIKQSSLHQSGVTHPKNTLQNIQQTKSNLDNLIQQLNVKLHDHFHKKQSQLIEQYKQQLVQAQKQLNELKANTNEQQIKNKMIERKKQLQKQRHQLIQTNMFFSKKCQDYKHKLAVIVAQGKQLEKQLLFLDSQINNAHHKKYQIIRQSQNTPQQLPAINQSKTNTLPLFSDRKPTQTSNKLVNSISVRDTTKRAILEESLISKGKKNIIRNDPPSMSKLMTKQIQKTPLEELFETTVEQVRSKRKGKKGAPVLKGQQFSDYEKKQIMQQFLSRQQVKRKIYQIIFESQDKKPMLPGSFQPESAKVKISFQDIN